MVSNPEPAGCDFSGDQPGCLGQFFPSRTKTCAAGGRGVPVRTEEDYHTLYQAAQRDNFPLLRTYTGTDDFIQQAEMYRETIQIAWGAISLFGSIKCGWGAATGICKARLANTQMVLRPHILHVVGYTEAHHATTAADRIESYKLPRRVVENAMGGPDMTQDERIQTRVEESALTLGAIRDLASRWVADPWVDTATLTRAVQTGISDTPQLKKKSFSRGKSKLILTHRAPVPPLIHLPRIHQRAQSDCLPDGFFLTYISNRRFYDHNRNPLHRDWSRQRRKSHGRSSGYHGIRSHAL